MSLFIRNFRVWWQKPHPLSEREDHRQVTFLELFYDLVYVVLIAELTHALSLHVDLVHILQFIFMFFIVFWSWINGTLYHDLHGNNDVRTRIFTFLQMFTVAAMAIFAHDAFGETAAPFAISYAFFQMIFIFLWWRTGVYDPAHRPLTRPYIIGFSINSLLFLISAFIPAPVRFYLWFVAVISGILLPVVTMNVSDKKPELQEQIRLSRTPTASLIERLGLFTIIVMGELIVGVVQGVAGQDNLTLQVAVIGGLGMLVAVSLWWIYFDFVSHRLPDSEVLLVWLYAHIPLTAGIAATGAALLNVIDHGAEGLPSEVRWLLVGAVSIALMSIAVLIRTVYDRETEAFAHTSGQVVMVGAIAVTVALGLSDMQTIPLLALLVVVLLTPVVYGIRIWLRSMETSAVETSAVETSAVETEHEDES